MARRRLFNRVLGYLGDIMAGKSASAAKKKLERTVGPQQAAAILQEATTKRQASLQRREAEAVLRTRRKSMGTEVRGGNVGRTTYVDPDSVPHKANSSNVHSYWYLQNKQILVVRYLSDGGGAGPIYHYYNVPKRVFDSMKSASSKGAFVWDTLRIRGTIFGHQYDYALVGTSDQNVPRKATVGGMKPREIVQGGQKMRSKLPGTGMFRSE